MTEGKQGLFSFFVKRNLTVDFKGGAISSDAGLLLVRQLDEKLGFTEGLAGCLDDRRHLSYVKQSQLDILRQRLYQIIAGYEDCNDAESLRHDPVFKGLAGRLLSDEALASQPTLSRFENDVTIKELYRVALYLLKVYLGCKKVPPSRVIVDIDTTDDEVHGHQQLSFFHGYYEQYIYHPLLVYDGDTGELITAVLRPGNVHASRSVVSIVKRLVQRLRQAFGAVRVVVRGDAGFAVPGLYDYCEAEGLEYVIGLITNDRLLGSAEELSERVRADYAQSRLKQRRFTETEYQADSWEHPRRVIIKVEHNDKGINRRFLVTNLNSLPEEAYDFYALRGDCENRIKELKNDLKADRLSCHRFVANQFRLLLHAAAYALLHALKKYLQGTVLENAQIGTIRCRLLKIGAQVVQSCRRLWVHLAGGYPWKRLFLQLSQQLTVT
jgi:hypothetical protein